MGVPELLRVVIGRQCSRFPVDVTYKKKRAMWFVCLFPCDPGEGVWATWLSCGNHVVLLILGYFLEMGVVCQEFFRLIAFFIVERVSRCI